MERLTKRLASGTADYNYPKNCFFDDGSGPDKIAQSAFRQKCIERLAEYEDSKLSPEQVATAKLIIEAAFSDDTNKAERIRELLKADREGRLEVLPCKVGDTVYVIDKGDYRHDFKPYVRPKTIYEISCKQNKYGTQLGWGVYLGPGDCGTIARYRLDKLGQSWFLTREEAEKALEAMKK